MMCLSDRLRDNSLLSLNPDLLVRDLDGKHLVETNNSNHNRLIVLTFSPYAISPLEIRAYTPGSFRPYTLLYIQNGLSLSVTENVTECKNRLMKHWRFFINYLKIGSLTAGLNYF